ncbi:hypothetical protein [Nonomuraea endophytica]|uniref:Uncharacterized protein n=1 Tax=Nonomuraea endophytica TaxID=714136 RepID=A0A7W8A4A7_9ACTN|nr:hypothetical protein [Nonomuraea endophytica]MBB5078048.1 hypothetical protein [Nonomuraea endophytica]
MTQSFGNQPAFRQTPFTPEEKARSEANFSPFVAQQLISHGRFQVAADNPDLVELFQNVARRVSDMLGQRVVSYSNGRYLIITFADQSPTTTQDAPTRDPHP